MNSLLKRPQSQKAQTQQFSNFQEGINAILSSTSSLDSSRVSNNLDSDYWINYYTQQKIKEKEQEQKIQFLSDKKKSTNILNGKRQLVFSRPYKFKALSKKQNSMKSDPTKQDSQEKVSDCLQQQQNCQIYQQQQLEQQREENSNEQEDQKKMNQIENEELIISPCISQNDLQSMNSQKQDLEQGKQKQPAQYCEQQIVSHQLSQIQQYDMFLSNQLQFQTPLSSGQTSPIQSVSTLAYRQKSEPKNIQKQIECVGVSSQRQLYSNQNNSFQTKHQVNNGQHFKSSNDINQRKSSIFKEDSNQNSNFPSKNQLDLQFIHIKKLKGVGEKEEKEIAKNLFSNHLILATSPTNLQLMQQQQIQSLQNSTPKMMKFQTQQSLQNNSSNNQVLEKSIINFQKQKLISQVKYNSFLSDLNIGSLKSSIHYSGEQNLQQQGFQSQQDLQYTKLKTESCTSQSRGSQASKIANFNELVFTSQNNYQDSFLESKNQPHKLFLLEGYSQINQAQKFQQSPQNHSADIQIQQQSQQQNQQNQQLQTLPSQMQQQYLFPNNKLGKQASFFQELNKQRIQSGNKNKPNNNNLNSNNSSTNNFNNNSNIVTQNQSNLSTAYINNNQQQQQNVISKKRLASANQYNRKHISNYIKQELLTSKVNTQLVNSQIEEQSNNNNTTQTQNSNNNIIFNPQNNKNQFMKTNSNIFNKINNELTQSQLLRQPKKMMGFNVLEGIQQLNIKQLHQLQGSQSTTNNTTSSQISNLTNKQLKFNNFTSPKTQKNFQVLYKICNKNILNAGLKEQKSTFVKLI